MRTLLGMLCLVVWSGSARAEGELDRAAISAGVAKIKATIGSCEGKATSGGSVRAKVAVAADGKVTSATHDATDKALGDCVVDVIKAATFPPSKSGGSFSYPFVFAAPAASIEEVAAVPPVQGAGPVSPKPPTGGDQGLDRQSIVTAMNMVKPTVRRCGAKSKSGGTVKIKVIVKPNGKPGAVTAEGGTAIDAKLKACAVAAVKTATFPKGMSGAFTFPFVFHGHDIASNAPAKDPAAAPTAIALDRAIISAGLALVKPRIMMCGESPNAGGTVKVKVVVDPDGKVQSAVAESAHDTGIGDCVVSAIKTATFAITSNGGSFSYPFVFKAKYPSPRGGTGSSTVASPVADENLDRAGISEGIAKVKASIVSCGDSSKAKGKVKVKITVGPNGSVSSASIEATPDPALGDCVLAAIKKATFKPTRNGGSFSYPFVF